MSLYLAIDLLVLALPLVLSFDRRVAFYRHWTVVFPAIGLSAIPFLLWDIVAAARGDWSFTASYVGHLRLFGLPIEEWIFFVAIPYACLFIFACLRHYTRPRLLRLPRTLMLVVALILILLGLFVGSHPYSSWVCLGAGLFLALTGLFFPRGLRLQSYWVYLAITYVPFIVANGLLTSLPVVDYSASAISGIRVLTIPVEDFVYSFTLLGLNGILYLALSEFRRKRAAAGARRKKAREEGPLPAAGHGSDRAVIIGSGLGGLSVAIRLAMAGWKVRVLEQSAVPGGKAGESRQQGFRFDTGPSLLTMAWVFDEVWESAGRRRSDYLDFLPLDPICRYYFPDGSQLDSRSGPDAMADAVETFSPGSGDQVRAYLSHARGIWELSHETFLESSLHSPSTYLNRRFAASLLKAGELDTGRSLHECHASYFSDPRLVQFFDRYATYNGSHPYKAPATLSVIPWVEYGMGAWAVRDGIRKIPMAMERLAVDLGVEIDYSSRVREISRGERVDGVVLDNGKRLDAGIVISNADYGQTLELLGPRAKERSGRSEPSSSALVFMWGMKADWPELLLHNVLFGVDYEKEFDEIFRLGHCPGDPTVYINVGSRAAPEDAPRGGSTWFVLVNAPWIRDQDWKAEIERTRKAVCGRIQKALGKNPEDDIVTEKIVAPPELAYSNPRASLYGQSSNSRLSAFLRPSNRSPLYPGLYFCGGSVHPGGGMPLVVLSGKIAADLVRRHERRPR